MNDNTLDLVAVQQSIRKPIPTIRESMYQIHCAVGDMNDFVAAVAGSTEGLAKEATGRLGIQILTLCEAKGWNFEELLREAMKNVG